MSGGVSFIVPVYNKAPWLPAVLDQLAAQRGSFEREYVFVDDGSTDGSLGVLRELTAGWPNVTIIEQANHGPAHATNRGMEHARMPFIKLCDADDLLADGATGVLLDALRRHPSAALAYGRARPFAPGEQLELAGNLSSHPTTVLREPLRLALRNNPFIPCQVLLRTKAVLAAGGCDERLPFAQDYTLTLRMALQTPFVRLDEDIAWFLRGVPGLLSNDMARELRDSTSAVAFLFADHPGLPSEFKDYACRRAAARAWRFARRRNQPGGALFSRWRTLLLRLTFSRPFRLRLRSLLPLSLDHGAFLGACASVFEEACLRSR